MIKKALNFINKDVWLIHTARLSKVKAFWVKFLRIILLTFKGFESGQFTLWPSALTYYSLLALVPVIAILMGIARGFKLEKTLEDWLLNRFNDQREIISKVIQFAEASLNQAGQGLIAGLGVLVLIWAVIKILRYMEDAFNATWEVKESRSIGRQCTDYLAMLILAPIIVLLTSGVSVFLTTQLRSLENRYAFLEAVGPALLYSISILSYILTFFTFTFLYMFMPNTKVKFFPALIAGIISGSIYIFVQWLYLIFQIGVAQYNAVYGTFAALPLFLIWLQLSWVIVLLGAKIAYAIQNVNAFELMLDDVRLSQRTINLQSLRIVNYCIKRFAAEKPAPSHREIAQALSLPLMLVHRLLLDLVDAKILSEVKYDKRDDNFYTPAMDINLLSVNHVLHELRLFGKNEPPIPHGQDSKKILLSLNEFERLNEESPLNIFLKDI